MVGTVIGGGSPGQRMNVGSKSEARMPESPSASFFLPMPKSATAESVEWNSPDRLLEVNDETRLRARLSALGLRQLPESVVEGDAAARIAAGSLGVLDRDNEPSIRIPNAQATVTVTRYGESFNGQPLGCGAMRPDLRIDQDVRGEMVLDTRPLAEGGAMQPSVGRNGLEGLWRMRRGVMAIERGEYSSLDKRIIAVGPADYLRIPCGTVLRLCSYGAVHKGEDHTWQGSAVESPLPPPQCFVGIRVDACPGCGPRHLDVSEQLISLLCGLDYMATGETCDTAEVTVEVLDAPR